MQALCGGDRLAMLLERSFLTRDELLFKVLRNLSQQVDAAIKAGFLPYMDQLASLLQVPLCSASLLPAHIHSLTHSLTHSLSISLTHPSIHSLAHPHPHSLTLSLNRLAQCKAEGSLCVQAPDIDSDLFVEVLGILVNVDIPSCDWASLITKHDLLNLLAGQKHLLFLSFMLSGVEVPVRLCSLPAVALLLLMVPLMLLLLMLRLCCWHVPC